MDTTERLSCISGARFRSGRCMRFISRCWSALSVSTVQLSTSSPVSLSDQVFHRPASPQGAPSVRRTIQGMCLPASQFGSKNALAGMMQLWPRAHENLSLAFWVRSSDLAFAVGSLSLRSLANQGMRDHGPTSSSRVGCMAARAAQMNGPWWFGWRPQPQARHRWRQRAKAARCRPLRGRFTQCTSEDWSVDSCSDDSLPPVCYGRRR